MVALSPQKASALRQLQRDVLGLQSGVPGSRRVQTGLDTLESAFPLRTFPTAAVHEFISADSADAAATSGFVCGLLHAFIKASSETCLWVSTRRTVYPPALAAFGLCPERIVFVDAASDREAMWAIEEGLKCEGLAAVVGEVREASFTHSRRLQLAVESSGVTGFIHRCNPRSEGANAFVSRWRIRPMASAPGDGLPGMGHPRWNVQLQKIRNGQPGVWNLEWVGGAFQAVPLLMPSVSPADSVPLQRAHTTRVHFITGLHSKAAYG